MPPYHFQRIEPKWQAHWESRKTFRVENLPRPGADGQPRPKLYVLDMFPYPSGEGLHVGHPEGYTATDILCRYKRMRGYDVLHPMGWDAFGLPAEQHAIKTGTHPGVRTRANIDNFRRQIKSLGFSYDWDREIDTTDPAYYRWTQWIFLRIHDTWYDPDYEWTDELGRTRRGKGRPVAELPVPEGHPDPEAYRDSKRLAYRAEVPVNWCPGLGTVLANEEVVDGKSEVGGFPVVRIPLKQWMLRITAYAERLLEDLETVDWPRPIKDMQRNWIGRSEGAEVDFHVGPPGDRARWAEARARDGFPESPGDDAIRVYTTRPDTLFGATYMVLAPEHPLVDRLVAPERRDEVEAYRARAAAKSELDRTDPAKTKTGVPLGAFAINPVNGREIPVWIADYVLMAYGTGAIMAVPGHDDRDFEFAAAFGLPVVRVVAPANEPGAAEAPLLAAETDEGFAVNSANDDLVLDGLPTPEAKAAVAAWLEARGLGRKTVNHRLRDWLFSRQRYWGEPFPILLDDQDRAHPVPESELPVLLPEMEDFKPSGKPEPPLGKATAWVEQVPGFRRETNTMPQWAGSCWYYLRYLDPRNDRQPWDPEIERRWMPVDLYVGGAEHAVLHLLYSRFWHKVLYDRGHVSTSEPFRRLVNQGMILGEMEYAAHRDANGRWLNPEDLREAPDGSGIVASDDGTPVETVKLDPDRVDKRGQGFVLRDQPEIKVVGRAHKMSKSRGNVINPDRVVEEYGADSLRLYEMFMGPLEAVKPWSMKGVEGVYRFLHRAWRMIVDHEAEELRTAPAVRDVPPTPEQARIVARAVAGVERDYEALAFNTAIAKLMEFVNAFAAVEPRPKSAMETFTLLLAPMAPHIAEELWQILGHDESLAHHPWPAYDPALLKDDEVEIPVQINGKLRARVTVPAELDADALEALLREHPAVIPHLEGKSVQKTIVRPGKLANFVVK